jgi:hypothetical protein
VTGRWRRAISNLSSSRATWRRVETRTAIASIILMALEVESLALAGDRTVRVLWSLPDADHRRVADAACRRLELRVTAS